MKKLMALVLTLIMVFTLAACGGNNNTPGDGDTQPPSQSGTSAPTITTGSGEASVTVDGEEYVGNYDGEYADGLFSGYGVWEFENWRYEGYWENGMPNGKGLLTESRDDNEWYDTVPDVFDENSFYNSAYTYEGTFVDALPDGDIVLSVYHIPLEVVQSFSVCDVCVRTVNTHEELLQECPVCGLQAVFPPPMGVPPWDGSYKHLSDNGDTASTPNTPDTPQDTSGSSGDTTPAAPPMDSHEGDEQYFTPKFPDYIITMQHMSGEVSTTKEATWEEYHLYSFEDDMCTQAINKLVFENAEDATTYRDLNYITSGSYTYSVLEVIDNVIFVTDSTVLYLLGQSAETLRTYYSPEDIVYDSMA